MRLAGPAAAFMLVASVVAPRPVDAQSCSHDCAVTSRDAHGCCPTIHVPVPIVTNAPTRTATTPAPPVATSASFTLPDLKDTRWTTQPLDPQSAAYAQRVQCMSGADARGCLQLGLSYYAGQNGATMDRPTARVLFEKACDSKVMWGCHAYAMCLSDGGCGAAMDQAAAFHFMRVACDGSFAPSCTKEADWLFTGEGIAKDHARAAALYRTACDANNALGCENLGNLLRHGDGVAQDVGAALTAFYKACLGNQRVGCLAAGWIVHSGEGGTQINERRAYDLFAKACALGASGGCLDAGNAIAKGWGTIAQELGAQAAQKATEYYVRGCNLSQAVSCNEAGVRYHRGLGVTPDVNAAKSYYMKGCNSGSKAACCNLGQLTLNDGPMQRDYAVQACKAACDEKVEWACTTYRSWTAR